MALSERRVVTRGKTYHEECYAKDATILLKVLLTEAQAERLQDRLSAVRFMLATKRKNNKGCWSCISVHSGSEANHSRDPE
jgi:hypothetical protein